MSPKILHNTNIPEFKKWVRKSKNYRTTKKKKKGRAIIENLIWVRKSKNYHTTKKKFSELSHHLQFFYSIEIFSSIGALEMAMSVCRSVGRSVGLSVGPSV